MLPAEVPANVLQMGWAFSSKFPDWKLSLSGWEEAVLGVSDMGPLSSQAATCGCNSESPHCSDGCLGSSVEAQGQKLEQAQQAL